VIKIIIPNGNVSVIAALLKKLLELLCVKEQAHLVVAIKKKIQKKTMVNL
jgi:hypothetical protein